MKKHLFVLFILTSPCLFGQDYTSYFTGNTNDLDTVGQSGICLMGGATEDDNAMTWFLERANGGDVLVLRTSGSDGYNDYMFNQLGVTLNSVETIVCNNAAASNDSYVQQAIQDAEAIWFAGGDQWNYISYWRDTPVDSLINLGIQNKGLVIGGTSAGMAIQGEYYFSAENGTVTSGIALNNPYDNNVTVDNTPFISNGILSNTITDTHYDNPDRKGRHVAFLARMVIDNNEWLAQGIACDEYTAVCIDENGIAKVYGGYPTYNDYAYFIRVNCDNLDTGAEPETCTSGSPLQWKRQNNALQVYVINGDATANNSFDLNDWTTASGGEWQKWWVDAGNLNEDISSSIDCTLGLEYKLFDFEVYPNPAQEFVFVHHVSPVNIQLTDLSGKVVFTAQNFQQQWFSIKGTTPGIYLLDIEGSEGAQRIKLIIE